jgi:hypothetical protein
MRLKSALFELLLLASIHAHGRFELLAHPQHEEHSQEPAKEVTSQAPVDHEHHAMPAAGNPVVWGSMDPRNASGTSWQPSSVPEPMTHRMAGGWMFMLHGNAFASVNRQGGPRGITKFESLNWGMVMAEHSFGPGVFTARTMLSLEPWTIPHGGAPQLFQTGETYRNRPIVDHQHPHNFFMELAAMYTLPLSKKAALQVYGGPVGEPALGPTAFMHRLSASEIPAAPLGHHLADSTHISEGVATLGFMYGPLKAEASAFNGHEPGEERWGIHTSGLNSYSFRVTLNLTDRWSGQVSVGHLRRPEAAVPISSVCGGDGGPAIILPPGVVPHRCPQLLRKSPRQPFEPPPPTLYTQPGNEVRSTASITYHRPLATGYWATTMVWGRNRETQDYLTSYLNGYLVESTLHFQRANYLYLRWELLDKEGLLSPAQALRVGLARSVLRVGAYTFGFVRDVPLIPGLRTGIGGDVTFYAKPSALDEFYGKSPVSAHLFLRVRPRHPER